MDRLSASAMTAASLNTTTISSKARSQLAIILRYYTSINPKVRRWGCMALYMWWAVYSTYRGVIKPKSKSKNKKSGASSSSSASASAAKQAAKETAEQAKRAGDVATGSKEAAPEVDADAVAPSSLRRSKRGGRRGPRVEVDAVFFERLGRILAIVLPGNKRKLVLESFFLVFRVSCLLISNAYLQQALEARVPTYLLACGLACHPFRICFVGERP